MLQGTDYEGHVDVLAWVPGTEKPANLLTKPHAGGKAEILAIMLS